MFDSLLDHEYLRNLMTEGSQTCPMCRARINFSNPLLEVGLEHFPLWSIISELGSRAGKLFFELHRQSLACYQRKLLQATAVSLLVSRSLPGRFIFWLGVLLRWRVLYRLLRMPENLLFHS